MGGNIGKPRVFRKTKIGQVVKGIPKVWVEKQDDEFYNRILLNKYPYFFRYRYKKARDDYKKYEEECNSECKYKFRMTISDLLKLDRRTPKQMEFLQNYYKYMPVVYSDSPMNLLCRHIEQIDFEISKKIRESGNFDHTIMIDQDHPYTEEEYKTVVEIFGEFKQILRGMALSKEVYTDESPDFLDYSRYRISCDSCMEDFSEKISDVVLITNCLVRYFFEDNPKANKELFWTIVGRYAFEAIKKNTGVVSVQFPFMNPDGDILYLNNRYSMREVPLV